MILQVAKLYEAAFWQIFQRKPFTSWWVEPPIKANWIISSSFGVNLKQLASTPRQLLTCSISTKVWKSDHLDVPQRNLGELVSFNGLVITYL